MLLLFCSFEVSGFHACSHPTAYVRLFGGPSHLAAHAKAGWKGHEAASLSYSANQHVCEYSYPKPTHQAFLQASTRAQVREWGPPERIELDQSFWYDSAVLLPLRRSLADRCSLLDFLWGRLLRAGVYVLTNLSVKICLPL